MAEAAGALGAAETTALTEASPLGFFFGANAAQRGPRLKSS